MTGRPSPSGVLYVDGTPDDATAALESEFGCDVRTVGSLAAAVDASDADPVAVLRTLRERDPYLPFVAFVSPDDGDESACSNPGTPRPRPGPGSASPSARR